MQLSGPVYPLLILWSNQVFRSKILVIGRVSRMPISLHSPHLIIIDFGSPQSIIARLVEKVILT
jgi:hypothetical protein